MRGIPLLHVGDRDPGDRGHAGNDYGGSNDRHNNWLRVCHGRGNGNRGHSDQSRPGYAAHIVPLVCISEV